ncbi:MAG TPA: hypothetical protein VJY35_16530 [Candidatus Eisenbacteria bacterium]|nr:hypothetical protein [Candidatus Eisenbacteria bacterium]
MKRTAARSPLIVADSIAAAPHDERSWMVGLVLACWAALAAGAALAPRFGYNLWDNFEYFTPMIDYAHGLWLRGVVPLWNPHQHLGEPILAAGQPGVFYLPYTISVLITRLLGLGPTRLMLVIVILHVPLAALGWYRLTRSLGVRPLYSALAALSTSLGGFLTTVTTVWIFMLPVFAWLPWILFGIVRQLTSPGWFGAAALVAGLVATACVGHPQMLVYQWLTAAVFMVGIVLVVRPPASRVVHLLGWMVLAGLWSLPPLLPMAELLPVSVRTESFSMADFSMRGVAPRTLIGWLLPVFDAPNGFLHDRASVMGYQGAWVMPAVLAGFLAFRSLLRTPLARVFGVSVLITALLLALALGGHSILYQSTYGLPIWSSLRWPFKLFLMSQGMLALTAALGLELWTRGCAGARALRAVPVAVFGLAAGIAFWLAGSPEHGGAAIVGVVGAVASLTALPWLQHRWATVLLAAGVFASAAAITASAHNMGMKAYVEPYATFGAHELGLTTDARVLPMTDQDSLAPRMGALGLLHAATANGYLGATGTTAGLIPTWYKQTLPCDGLGVPASPDMKLLIGSRLLRSFNIGYLVSGTNDLGSRMLLERASGLTLVHSDSGSLVYQVDDVLPRAYFASRTYPYSQKRFLRSMLLNESPMGAAFVDGWSGTDTPAMGHVRTAHWEESRMTVDVDAPEGGFLVVSVSDFPGWSCRVDERPALIQRVNGRTMGVLLPRGARRVRFELHSNGLRWGLGLALGGTLIAALWAFVPRRARGRRPAARATA